jgi:cytoskeletal protein RodZ
MMKKVMKHLGLTTPFLLLATQVDAHPGSHMEFSTPMVLQHLLSSPFHMGLVIVVALSLGVFVWKVLKPSSMRKMQQ